MKVETEHGARFIVGLKTEIPEGVQLDARAISILLCLEHNSTVQFEVDDSQQDQQTLADLRKVCGNVGYLLVNKSDHKFFIIDEQDISER